MMEFKDKMNEYIERSGISKTVLANITGVHERTIDRGCSFLIKDSEKYKTLCSFLSLSKNERQELDDLYIKTQFSEDEFVIINAFNDMLLKFDTLLDIEYRPVTTEFKKQSVIEREENICAYIMNLVKSIKDKDCEVNVFMKNPVNSLAEMLSECIRHNDRIQMKLVTAFEIGDNSSMIKTSIRKLCSLLPLFRHPHNVAVKYFYTALSAVDFPFPIAVIINSDVIAIDDNCSTALHFDSSEIAHLYKTQFDKIYASSMTLVSFMNIFDCLYGNLVVASDKSVSSALQASCCIYKYLPAGLADKYVKKDLQHREKIVEMADNHVNMIRELKKNIKVIFTYNGIKEFMQSGTNDDLPKTLLEPMSLEDRCAVLKGLLDDIKDNGGISDNLMLKQNLLKLTFSCNQSIHYVAKGAMISYVHPEYDNVYIYINEEYISNAVKMFLKYLDKSRLAYSQIETISYLTNLLEESQRKGEVDND